MEIIKGHDSPILLEKVGFGDYRLRWNVQAPEEGVRNNYEYLERVFVVSPSIDEIKNTIFKYFNSRCDEEILSGLQYEEHTVWLSTENQFNYKAAYDFAFQRQVIGLPFETPMFKLGPENSPTYVTFEDFEELTAFITACFTHIQTTLSKYWFIKDSINWSEYELN